MRLGIFGGSFDPVHYGHLLLAEYCREQCQLDRVWFLPASVSPHKRQSQPTSAAARVSMLRLAIGGNTAFEVSTVEVDRGGVSFTVDTLELVRQQQPEADLFFLMGADTLDEFASWREPGRICELASPLVVARPGASDPNLENIAHLVSPQRLAQIQQHVVAMPRIELSSSELRRRIAAGESVRYQTPRAVEKYIEANGLYGRDGREKG